MSATDMFATYNHIPPAYNELRYLYKVLLTLPVTTASVERKFSTITIVKQEAQLSQRGRAMPRVVEYFG